MKWKDRLLSSSIPLEYEVAKLLAKNNFSVDFDYSYKRLDTSLEKEFSFDIKAGGYYPFPINSKIKIDVDLLIECKYRNPNVSWLFINDINIEDFSNFSSKGVIKFVDEFSEYTTAKFISGHLSCETCLKGLEVNTQSGEVHDTGIVHGINQLVYGMPPLLERHLFSSLVGHLSDNRPYIICPILVTTADLRILKPNFSIDSVMNAQTLEDISEEVPFLSFYSDVYPSFEEHCRNTFKNTLQNDTDDRFGYFKKLRKNDFSKLEKSKNEKLISNPEFFMIELQNGIGNDLFKEILICNLKHFPELLKQIKSGIRIIGKNLRRIKNS